VLANITDFQPYFYVALPRGFTADDFGPFRDYLNVGFNVCHI
jgi:DNA polymerase delta subunit 1